MPATVLCGAAMLALVLATGCTGGETRIPPAVAASDGVVLAGMPSGLLAPPLPCRPEDAPPTVFRVEQTVLLNIADRGGAPGAPEEGWCGEAALQQALLYFGAFVPQREINAAGLRPGEAEPRPGETGLRPGEAGRPAHPDLYEQDIGPALKALRMDAQPCVRESRDLAAFGGWLRHEIDAGRPVVIGLKINPTKHPEWMVDHFVLAVGYTEDSLIYNTTWDKQETRTWKDLATTDPGFSLVNGFKEYFGVAVTGQVATGDSSGRSGPGAGFAAVRLFPGKEEDGRLAVTVKCEGLETGARYVVYRLNSPGQKSARPLCVFDATGPVYAFRDVMAADQSAIYRCRRVAAGP